MNLGMKLLAPMFALYYATCWLSVSGETRGFLFENGKYSYKIVLGSDDLRSWFEAEEICREREGGHLASITSKAENTFVNEKILLLGHLPDEVQELWLGAIDERLISVDAYHWVDGENFRYSSALWAPGEPNDGLQEDYEVCVALKSKGKRAEWKGDDCYASKGYICKIKGVPKRLVEQKRFGYEFDHGNYIYKFIFMQYDMLPWPEAEIYCRDVEEGHLARVRDLQVSKTIEKDLRKIRYYFGFSKMWIGASDLYNEGQFEWTSGGPVEFQHWVQGEPSGRRRGMEEDCVVVTADPHWAHWKDEYCLHHLPFICQTKVCHKRADIGFAVDISSSVRINGFRRSKEFFKKVLNRFPISERGVHAGLIHFSSTAHLIFGFDEHYTLSDVENAVDRTKYRKGGTRTDKALKLARTRLFALPPEGSSRRNIPRFLVVTTDGISMRPSTTGLEAQALKNEGVHIIVVGVGFRTHMKELRAIASRPQDVIKVRSFAYMERIVENVRSAICQD